MVDVDGFLDAFAKLSDAKVLVLGDLILDSYAHGTVERISPEAPVMVFHEKEKKHLLGGAGNVAYGLNKLGVDVKLISRVGEDKTAEIGRELLENEGIETGGIFVQKNTQTTNKTRLLSNNHQVIRIDHEACNAMPGYLEDCVIEYLETAVKSVDLVMISDYAKGFLSDRLLVNIMSLANKNNCKVIVDPKGKDFQKYQGAYLLKPNEREAYDAAGISYDQDVDQVFASLKKSLGIKRLLITRSERGMSYFEKNIKTDYPTEKKQVVDVTGAGDACLVIISTCLALNMSMDQAIRIANLTARRVVENTGCYSISLSELITLVFKQSSRSVIRLENLKVIQGLHVLDEYVLLRIDQKIVDFKNFIEGIHQIKGVGQKILVLVEQNLEDQFHLLLAIEKIDMVFKFDRRSMKSFFDTSYIYSNAKFVQNQSVLC